MSSDGDTFRLRSCGSAAPPSPLRCFSEVLILNDFKSLFPEVLILIDFKSFAPEVLILVEFKVPEMNGLQKLDEFLEVLILIEIKSSRMNSSEKSRKCGAQENCIGVVLPALPV